MKRRTRLPVALMLLTLAACRAPAPQPWLRPEDNEWHPRDTGIVLPASLAADAEIEAVDGEDPECPRRCRDGLRLPAGTHRLRLAWSERGDDGTRRVAADIEIEVEPRHRYELHAVDDAAPGTLGVLDLGADAPAR